MTKKKKNNLSNRRVLKNKKLIFITIPIFIIILIIINFISNTENSQSNINGYYEGELYTANYAANMLDYIGDEENIVISPFNINTSLAILYNATDNNSSKQIKSYFKSSLKNLNNNMSNKISLVVESENTKTEYNTLYETLITTLKNKSYDKLTIDDIKNLNTQAKAELQLLLKKLSLAYSCIENTSSLSIETIEKYEIKEKDLVTNEYSLKKLLDEELDNYETYLIENKVINYNETYMDISLKDQINDEYLDITSSLYNSNITYLDFSNQKESTSYINNKIKELTDEKITRIVKESDIKNNSYIMINSLYFNYEWETSFKNDGVSSEEFYNSSGKVSLVDMMYSEETIYLENTYCEGFIKDFKDSHYSFIGILPKEEGNFSLSSLDIDSLINTKKNEKILIGLPTFEYQYSIDLESLLNHYNITDIFNNNANFTKLTDEFVSLDKSIQKITISIGQKGTILSSSSATNISNFITEDYNHELIFNRPFAFIIINNETNDIIIIGKITSLNETI